METRRSQTPTDSPDSPINALVSDHDLLRQLESLRQCYTAVESKCSALEADLVLFQRQRDDATNRNANLVKLIDELSGEKDFLGGRIDELEISLKGKEEEFDRRLGEELREREELRKELEVSWEKIDKLEVEKQEGVRCLMKSRDSIFLMKDHMAKIIECLNDDCEKVVIERSDDGMTKLEMDEELGAFSGEIMNLLRLAEEAASKVSEFKEASKKEHKELENSVVSLTEENRDVSSLLRIALAEKEAVEKSLNRLKGNAEQKRVALLQFAERGLQRVGFGFMIGSGSNEQSLESSSVASTTGSNKSDHGSESEEEVVSLASTVERIMKSLRLEITQLRRSLEESRSDTERLQSLTEKQAQKIEENTLYIKELEDRERVLTRNVEELLIEIKESEAEVARWREACELEVEAGKNEIKEREKLGTFEEDGWSRH
ncbi:uncharacterized protein At3g49055 isoform X2 [Carica papaya]|uniref:uncharacterized protein At3g49055 isoform X2 n=1 Tax=Carica papaya TaxID=3649 RepID=UPI000B8CB252|nr:uncharacterized protein At3g49055 isoform X2 [Carica papaya]